MNGYGCFSRWRAGDPSEGGAVADSALTSQNIVLEAANLDDHIQYTRSLLDKHAWSAEAREQIVAALERIRLKLADPALYLGIVGEFSAGKSTFINAIIRDDLLKTDVLQATTAAATILTYGKSLDVAVHFRGGERLTYSDDGRNLWKKLVGFFKPPTFRQRKHELREFIHKTTADESVAAKLQQVTIFHPSPVFKQSLVIVDTPGANAENQRHVEVARWALEERCDAAVVIIPADVPLAQTLARFIEQHLSDVVHRCVFVVTKIDLIRRRKEHARLLKNIEKRLCKQFDLRHARVIAAAPRLVVDKLTGDLEEGVREKDLEYHLGAFETLEKDLWRIMREQRQTIQAERLALLLGKLMQWLPQELARYEEAYRQRHEALVRNQIPDLGNFIVEQKSRHGQQFKAQCVGGRARISTRLTPIRDEVLELVKADLDAISDKEQLQSFGSNYVNIRMAAGQADIQRGLAVLFTGIGKKADKQLNVFEEEFKGIYSSLATLGGSLSTSGTARHKSADAASLANVMSQSTGVDQVLENGGLQLGAGIGGGAIVGTVLGTLLLPGIGSVLGGALGGWLGSLFGPSFESQKETIWAETIKPAIDQSFLDVQLTAERSFDQSIAQSRAELDGAIDRYFAKYNTLVQQMIQRDAQERAQLDQMRHAAAAERQELTRRRDQLDAWRAAMRKV